jgi:hypothetical protein
MKIKVNLENSFITFNSFHEAYILSGRINPSSNGYFQGKDPIGPFLFDKLLYVPVLLDGKTAGLLHASVSCHSSYASGFHPLRDAGAIAQAGVKISSQCDNLLQQVDPGAKMFDSSGGRPFRCRPDDAVKALAMGLLSVDSQQAAKHFTSYCHYMSEHCDGMAASSRNSLVLNALRDGSLPKVAYGVSTTYVRDGKSVPGVERVWNIADAVTNTASQRILCRNMSRLLPGSIVRTAVQVDKSNVHKWRKPPQSSMWPWTMDHHWFLCESSPIATAHHSMMALMDPGSKVNGRNHDEEICTQLPLVIDQLTMDKLRKLMEAYFQDIDMTVEAKGPRYSEFHKSNGELRWVGTSRYSQRATKPEESPTAMCLALGVRPKLDGRKFKGFVPAENNLISSTTRFHCTLTPRQLNSNDPKVACIVMYSCGLISDIDFRNLMGKCVQDHDPSLEAGHVKLPIGPLVTVLLPRESWYSGARKALASLTLSKDTHPPLSEAEANVALVQDAAS